VVYLLLIWWERRGVLSWDFREPGKGFPDQGIRIFIIHQLSGIIGIISGHIKVTMA
jgi:hypothetical protein